MVSKPIANALACGVVREVSALPEGFLVVLVAVAPAVGRGAAAPLLAGLVVRGAQAPTVVRGDHGLFFFRERRKPPTRAGWGQRDMKVKAFTEMICVYKPVRYGLSRRVAERSLGE